MTDGRLPEFDRPPLIEVVCGVTFDPLPRFTTAHIGRWWNRLGPEYEQVQEMPRLRIVIEGTADGSHRAPKMVEPLPRLWFTRSDQDRLVQLQREKLLLNWRKTRADHVYPRYKTVSREFFGLLEGFASFCDEEVGGRPDLIQYELTYINHVPLGDGWTGLSDLGGLLRGFGSNPEHEFLPQAEALDTRYAYALPENAGRLHVRAQSAVRRADDVPIIVLDLTARGFLPDTRKWFELAHDWIVRGFADFTESQVQNEIWGRTQ